MTFDFDPSDYRAPHCNEQVLHAPGECFFCDKYPERQQARLATNTPFSPNEQAWGGNQAGGYSGSLVSNPIEGKCDVRMRRGWKCTRGKHSSGPCALKPKWWNLAQKNWGWPA